MYRTNAYAPSSCFILASLCDSTCALCASFSLLIFLLSFSKFKLEEGREGEARVGKEREGNGMGYKGGAGKSVI